MTDQKSYRAEDLPDHLIEAIEKSRHPVEQDLENLRTFFQATAHQIGPENARISLERLDRVEAALNLRAYAFDEGVYGAVVVCAPSEERAWEIVETETDRIRTEVSCQEVILVEGVIWENIGDR